MLTKNAAGIILLGAGAGELSEPVSPDELRRSRTLWSRDMVNYGPWKLEEATFSSEGESFPVWRSEKTFCTDAILVCGPCTSSMDVAWHLIANRTLSEWDSVLAVEQRSGRGRLRRQWISPPGNIYGSWLWPKLPEKKEQSALWSKLLPLVAAYVVAHALDHLGVHLLIKWTNDLIWQDLKVGGILIEDKREQTLVGIGLNLATAPGEELMRSDSSLSAASLSRAGLIVSPLECWLQLTKFARNCYEDIIRTMIPSDFIMLFNRRLAWLGEQVTVVKENSKPYMAQIAGLAQDGGLVIKRNGIETALYTGAILPLNSHTEQERLTRLS